MRAALAAAVLAAFTSAQAQDKPAASPPPSWQQGKPSAMSESSLHPFAIEMTGKPAGTLSLSTGRSFAGLPVISIANGCSDDSDIADGLPCCQEGGGEADRKSVV